MKPIRWVSRLAIRAAAAPTNTARSEMKMTRRSIGAYCGGAWTVASAGAREGATGSPSSPLREESSSSATRRSDVQFVLAEHRRRGNIYLREVKPPLEQVGERGLIARSHRVQGIHHLRLDSRRCAA